MPYNVTGQSRRGRRNPQFTGSTPDGADVVNRRRKLFLCLCSGRCTGRRDIAEEEAAEFGEFVEVMRGFTRKVEEASGVALLQPSAGGAAGHLIRVGLQGEWSQQTREHKAS